MKVQALMWVTDKVCRMITAKLDNGLIKIKKKTFQVDKSQPYFYLTGGFLRKKVTPLYILKHNSPYPITMPAIGKLQYSSENITNLLELKTLDNILKPPEARKMDTIMFIIIGVVMGSLVSAVLFLTKVIQVPA
jgi:protein involved in sex pheromone biosynthesis